MDTSVAIPTTVPDTIDHSSVNFKWVGVGAVVLLMAFFPMERRLSPEWTVMLVDENRNPVPNVLVERSWDDYSFDVSGGDEQRTNERGIVTFSRRSVRLNLLQRIYRAVPIILNVHGGFGTLSCNLHFPYDKSRKIFIQVPVSEGGSTSQFQDSCQVPKIETLLPVRVEPYKH